MFFCNFAIITPWKKEGPFIWTNLYFLHPKVVCDKFGWKWPNVSGEEDFLISSIYLGYFVIISPWKKAGPFIWTNLNPPHPRMHCAKFGLNWPSGSGEEDFQNLSMCFCNFVFISPWKKEGPFIWTNLNSLQPRMLCVKFGWNWPSSSGEEEKNGKSLGQWWQRRRWWTTDKSSL